MGVWDKIPPVPVYFSLVCSSKAGTEELNLRPPFRKAGIFITAWLRELGFVVAASIPPVLLQHPSAVSCPGVRDKPWPWGHLWGSLGDAQGPWCVSDPLGSPCNDRCPLGWSVHDPRGLLGVSGFYWLTGNGFTINLGRSGLEALPSLPTHSQLLLSTLCHPDQVSPWSDPAQGSRQLCQHGGTLAATTASMSDFWHKLGCCVVEKPQPVSTSILVQPFRGGQWAQQGLMAFIPLQKKRRRRIDRSMIGEPMNFVHLTHIGSGDMAAGEGLPMVPQR